VLSLGEKVGIGIIEKIPDLIPTAENLYIVSKQVLIGLPFELLLSGIDKLCKYDLRQKYQMSMLLNCVGSIALAAGNTTEPYNQPKIGEMNYVLFTESENISIPITESIKLWKHEKFDPKKNVVIMVTGWNTDIDAENEAAGVLGKAYRNRGDTNFILIDTACYVDTLYAWSAFNTQELGKGLGMGLAELINVVPLEKIHVMGHSLG
jgi:hypothetical protein